MKWLIQIQDHTSFKWLTLRPTVDGEERTFATRREAEDFAYDYGIAGGRNQAVRYAMDAAPSSLAPFI